MVRYSCDQYQERESNYLEKTHFQNPGRNWALVPDLCKSELSGGSPCYATWRGEGRRIGYWRNAAVKAAGGETWPCP